MGVRGGLTSVGGVAMCCCQCTEQRLALVAKGEDVRRLEAEVAGLTAKHQHLAAALRSLAPAASSAASCSTSSITSAARQQQQGPGGDASSIVSASSHSLVSSKHQPPTHCPPG